MKKWEEFDEKEAIIRLDELGKQILFAARDELYMGMRFLDVALCSFDYAMDMTISPFGTDGRIIYFHPQQLGGMYRTNRVEVNRGYLHMVMHCIFRHFLKGDQTDLYWNLSCDIAVERIMDGFFHRSVRHPKSLLRRETYRKLERAKKVLNAERIYVLLKQWNLTEKEFHKIAQEFYVDDHKYWISDDPQKKPDPNLQQKWKDLEEKMETDLETFSKEAVEQTGELLGQIKIENREKYDYKKFLRKFAVMREEIGVDPDSFDYSFYSYGLRLYGNMPLIEPQETKEVKKIDDFVVVIDTSMSCSKKLTKKFLEETYCVLSEENSFMKKVNVHILQCDEKVHSDVKITSKEELKSYMDHLELYGQGGTDFRPAFAYVEELLERGEFQQLKGLIYFTDGYGTYPKKMPRYKTAFVFMQEDYQDRDVPPWAVKLILREDEWNIENGKDRNYGYKKSETRGEEFD